MCNKTILIITPHLSTGGAPQFTLNKINLLKDYYNVYCVEYDFVSPDYIVQRNQIIDILGDNFISLGDYKLRLIELIDEIKPDIISMEEFPESFMSNDISKKIYTKDRSYNIFESTHSSINSTKSKKWLPDKFIFVSEYSANMYKELGVPFEIIEYPIDAKEKNTDTSRLSLNLDSNYKHILNVGLFTPGKNQEYAFDLARNLLKYKIKFHFVGNQAGNFQNYWTPLMNEKPSNCIIHGERNDVDLFLQASDLFLFTSKFELNPLVIKEALMYKLPTLMFNLDTYCNSYDDIDSISYLTGNLNKDTKTIIKMLNPEKEIITVDFEEITKKTFEFKNRDLFPHFLNHLGLNNKGVELGTFKGMFSKTILNNWFGKLYMVDVWRPLSIEEYDDASNHREHIDAYSEAMFNISGYEDRAYMLRMYGNDASELFEDNSLDFIYIDANHTYEGVKVDIEKWYPKIKKGGLISGHDYLPKHFYENGEKDIPLYLFPDDKPEESYYAGMFGVNPAVDEFAKNNGYEVSVTDEFLGTWWFIKK